METDSRYPEDTAWGVIQKVHDTRKPLPPFASQAENCQILNDMLEKYGDPQVAARLPESEVEPLDI